MFNTFLFIFSLIFFFQMCASLNIQIGLLYCTIQFTTTIDDEFHMYEAIDLFIEIGTPQPSIWRMHWMFNELALNELIGQYGVNRFEDLTQSRPNKFSSWRYEQFLLLFLFNIIFVRNVLKKWAENLLLTRFFFLSNIRPWRTYTWCM